MINDDTIKKTICKNITKYRKLAGLSQKEFAKKLGAAPSRVSSWETGANSTDIDTLFKICDILNVSINDMCGIYPDANILLSYLEQEHIKKYRALDPHGKEMVDFTLLKEWERSTAEARASEKVVPIAIREDTDYLTVQAAHNDAETTAEELEKMQRDIELMKRMKDHKI